MDGENNWNICFGYEYCAVCIFRLYRLGEKAEIIAMIEEVVNEGREEA